MSRVRVFHGDDSEAFRRLIAELLPADGLEIVGGSGTPDGIVDGVLRERPDVLLLDQLPGAAEVVDRLRDAAPEVRVVVLSGHARGDGDRELEARVDEYVVKGADLDAMRAAVLGG